MWDIVLTVLILVLMLGILIMTHELGHLIVAKAFNVYCLEYSIGFGPRLFHHKRKGGETEFSIRAIPLGGYVSMYSEEAELPDGQTLPRERSIEGISHPRRAFVMLAGIAVNLFIAVLFAFIYAVCIPTYVSAEAFDTGVGENGTFITSVEESSAAAYSLRISGTIGEYEVDSEKDRLFSPCQVSSVGTANVDYPYLIDSEASINGERYVALFNFETLNGANDFYSLLEFYPADEGSYVNVVQKALGVSAKPVAGSDAHVLQAGDDIIIHLTTVKASDYDSAPDWKALQNATERELRLSVSEDQAIAAPSALNVDIYTYWAPFHLRLLNGCYYVANFFKLIGTAFAMIFTGNFGAVGSIVAAGAQISTLTHQIGVARTFFFYGGFLSLNLAIFNLLPFPGLDGYQLLVTVVEGLFKKEIPPKVKNIISYAGLGILLIFSVVIILRDIVGLF